MQSPQYQKIPPSYPVFAPIMHIPSNYSPSFVNRSMQEPMQYANLHNVKASNTFLVEQNKQVMVENRVPRAEFKIAHGQRVHSRVGEMKTSYMGPDNRETAYIKENPVQYVKPMKKMPRVSESLILLPEMDTKETLSSEHSQQNESTKKSLQDQLKSPTLNYVGSMKKLDPEDKFKMRKSSYDPTENWKRQSMTKIQKVFRLDDFQKVKELGAGKYGKVFLVKQKETGFLCALKVIEKKMLKQQQITEQFIRELKIQTYLNHSNIIKMFGFFDDSSNIYIILEVALDGQLYKQIKKNISMSEAKAVPILRQIVQAVNQLHSYQIIHRDIKPENIVMQQGIVKLCDFGWSVYHGQTLRNTFCGTPLYVSPEILKGNSYDEKIDIWSIGILAYEILVGQNPFKITKQEELIKIVKDNISFPTYIQISEEAKQFITSCLQKNPKERANIRELLSSPLLKKFPQKNHKNL